MIESRLSQTLYQYRGQNIGIYKTDGSYIEGTLYRVKDDFLKLKTLEEEIIYINLNLILAVSKDTKDFRTATQIEDGNEATTLLAVINQHIYKWVTIHCQNKVSFKGILSATAHDHIILTDKNKQWMIHASQIIDFYPGEKKKSNNEKSEKEVSQKTKEDESLNAQTDKKDTKNNQNTKPQTPDGKKSYATNQRSENMDAKASSKTEGTENSHSQENERKEKRKAIFFALLEAMSNQMNG